MLGDGDDNVDVMLGDWLFLELVVVMLGVRDGTVGGLFLEAVVVMLGLRVVVMLGVRDDKVDVKLLEHVWGVDDAVALQLTDNW